MRLGEFGELSGRRKALDRRRQRGVRVGVVRTIPATISTMLSTTSPVRAPPKICVILAAGQPSSCRPTTDPGCKPPFKEPPLTAESGGATRAALLAMRAHRGTGSSNPLPSSGESGANSRLPPGVQAVIVILGNHEFAAKSVPSAAPTAADHRGGSESLLSPGQNSSRSR